MGKILDFPKAEPQPSWIQRRITGRQATITIFPCIQRCEEEAKIPEITCGDPLDYSSIPLTGAPSPAVVKFDSTDPQLGEWWICTAKMSEQEAMELSQEEAREAHGWQVVSLHLDGTITLRSVHGYQQTLELSTVTNSFMEEGEYAAHLLDLLLFHGEE